MAKKPIAVSLRKPPPPVDLDAFVAGSPSGDESPATTPLRGVTEGAVVSTSRGRELRELVLYLPEDLARQLAAHCADVDRDVSNVIAEALRAHLEKKRSHGAASAKPAIGIARLREIKDAVIAFLREKGVPVPAF